MRKMPQIPRDVFFGQPATQQTPAAETVAPAPVVPPPPSEEKVQVTIYLSNPAARHLETVRFHLLNEYNVKVSKSAIAEYALTQIGDDLGALAAFFSVGER